MEVAGLTLGALGVVALFSLVQDSLQALSRARNYPKLASKLRVRFLIEEVRLQQWARLWGYPDTDMDANLQSFSPQMYQVAVATLEEIATTLSDFDKLRRKYGLEPAASKSPTSQESALSSTMPHAIGKSSDNSDPALVVLSRPLRARKPSFDISLLARGSWALDAASKLEALIVDMQAWNNGLQYFQPPKERQSMDLALMIEMLNLHDRKLQELVEGSEGDEAQLLHQTAVLRQYSESLERNSIRPTKFIQDKDLLLDRKCFVFFESNRLSRATRYPQECWQEGLYQKPASIPPKFTVVLVEWKVVPSGAKIEHQIVSRMRIQNIARLLHSSTRKPSGFAVLCCIGITIGELGEYGLVFELPEREDLPGISLIPGDDAISPPEQPMQTSACSLWDILRGREETATVYMPPLESRFGLALRLCTSFLHFHSASWIHKRFSSHNVIILLDPTSHKPTGTRQDPLKDAFIIGFGYSRPDDEAQSISLDTFPNSLTSAKGALDLGDALYAHPSFELSVRGMHSRACDIYALGMVLLEIGLWTRLDVLFGSQARWQRIVANAMLAPRPMATIQDEIIKKYTIRLRESMGGIFESIVRWCLIGQFEEPENSGEEGDIGNQFYWKVLRELEKCKV